MRRARENHFLGVFARICLLACILPSACFACGTVSPRYPARSIGRAMHGEEGMSSEDVIATLGVPHRRVPTRTEGGERWYYYTNALEEDYLGLHIGTDGRVSRSWIP